MRRRGIRAGLFDMAEEDARPDLDAGALAAEALGMITAGVWAPEAFSVSRRRSGGWTLGFFRSGWATHRKSGVRSELSIHMFTSASGGRPCIRYVTLFTSGDTCVLDDTSECALSSDYSDDAEPVLKDARFGCFFWDDKAGAYDESGVKQAVATVVEKIAGHLRTAVPRAIEARMKEKGLMP